MRKKIIIILVLMVGFLTPFLQGYAADGGVSHEELRLYPVSDFLFLYQYPHPDHPSEAKLKKMRLTLAKTSWGYALPSEKPEERVVNVTLNDIEYEKNAYLSAGVLQEVIHKAVTLLKTEGLMGIYIMPHPEDVTADGMDVRESWAEELRFVVYTSTVHGVITKANGQRFADAENTVNHKAHEWIKKSSPLQPLESRVEEVDDLLNKEDVEGYLAYLNRHPGRHVSMSVVDAQEGKAALEYRVTESKPWIVLAQFTNTGTGNTSSTQKRAGFIHNQLSGNDDILTLDYTTAGFDDFYSVLASYDAPWGWDPSSRTRLGFTGSISEFTSTDVGLPGVNFTGENKAFGVQLNRTLFQRKELFVDAYAGVDWRQIEVNNQLAAVRGNEQFLKPSIGVSVERQNRLTRSAGSVTLETNLPNIAGTRAAGLIGLGRATTDDRWWKLGGSFQHSFFLEPFLYGAAFRDPATPESSTLAHEVQFNVRGQLVLGDDRLIAQEKLVAGGLHSVRGYPQSIVSGDNGYVGSLEYRFHLPRVLPVSSKGKVKLFGSTFRLLPEQAYSVPDWDLVLKAFTDIGQTADNQNIAGLEFDETLWSLGVGAELQLSRNVRFQIDFARAMSDLKNGRARAGNNEIHLSLTLLY